VDFRLNDGVFLRKSARAPMGRNDGKWKTRKYPEDSESARRGDAQAPLLDFEAESSACGRDGG
jgi:hypothetical protein